MVSKAKVSAERWTALGLFLLYDIVQIWIVGHLKVRPDDSLIFRYSVEFTPEFQLGTSTIIVLFFIPFIISYMFAIGSISNSDMVQIVGPDSLLQRAQMEFHKGNPEGKEFSKENIEFFLHELAEGEPEGTFENLQMLLTMGILVSDLIEKAGVPSIKRVYMSDDLAPNAFTLRVIPIPYIGQDWIIINRNVIDILDQTEIRAVVAHEIGHAARKDSWINSALYSPRLVIIFLWSIVLAAMASIILNDPFSFDSFMRLFTLIGFFFVVRVFMNAGHRLTSYAYRRTELLADHYAADLVGSEDLINALIKIGQRGEVIRSINVELEWIDKKFEDMPTDAMAMRVLNFFDPGETDKNKARDFAIQFYVRTKLNQIFRGFRIPIEDDEFNEMVKTASENVMKERGIEINEERALNVLGPERKDKYTKDWRSADLDANERLDKEEITKLVEDMRKSGKAIFETEALERLGVVPGTKTHPQVTQRITFLYDNLIAEQQ